jgi:hypothetical protein
LVSNDIPKAQTQQQTVHPQALSGFVRKQSVSQTLSTLALNMLNAVSAKWNYATRTDWKLTINNITDYQSMKGYYQMGFYHLPAGLTLSHHNLTRVDAPQWPSTNSELTIYL